MKSFRLQNIKSFTDSGEIELRPITIFAGRNSSGKSALVRFPVVLKQTFQSNTEAPILLNGKSIDYGNFSEVVHNQTGNSFFYEISFSVDKLNIATDFYKFQPSPKISTVKLNFEITYKNVIQLKSYSIYFDDSKVISFENQKAVLHSFVNFNSDDEIICPISEKIIFDASIHQNTDFIINTNDLQFKDDDNQNILSTLILIKSLNINKFLKDFFGNIVYISSFRQEPLRIYRASESVFNDVGTKGDLTATILTQNTEVQVKVSEWLIKTFGYKLDIIKNPDSSFFEVKVRHVEKTFNENLVDVGSGIAQVLPIITQVYFDLLQNKSRTFVIEEPEIHLHPNAQVELAELFAKIAKKTKSTFIIETHSEHLIRKFQSIVADVDSGFNSDDILIYQTDLNSSGASEIEKIEITDNGQFSKKWKSGFFDKAYQLSKELMQNISKSNRT